MQTVKPVNIATMKYNRKRKSRGKWIVYATNFKSNWISKAIIIVQAIHEAIYYIHHCDSISKSSNYMCMLYCSTNAIMV